MSLLVALGLLVSNVSPLSSLRLPTTSGQGFGRDATDASMAVRDITPESVIGYVPEAEDASGEPEWDGGTHVDKQLGMRIAEMGVSLCMSAVDDGTDYEQLLHDLGLYGTKPGQYTYSGGRFQGHMDTDTSKVAPNESLPNAERYIEFTMRRREDGSTPPGGGTFADCAVMPANLYDYFGLPFKEFNKVAHIGLKLPKYGGRGEEYDQAFETEHYLWIPCDPGKTFQEQCEPGDILCNGKIPHYMLYVGNEVAQRWFPDTTGYMCEAGSRSQSFWGVTRPGYEPSGDWLICRPKA